jgi:ribonuclease HI
MNKTTLYFDGGCNPNPGQMCCCTSTPDNEFIVEYIGLGTNNIAEWSGLILALTIAINYKVKHIRLIGDSKLVVNQALGNWKIKKQHFLPFKQEFDSLITQFDSYGINWIERSKNLAGIHLESIGW